MGASQKTGILQMLVFYFRTKRPCTANRCSTPLNCCGVFFCLSALRTRARGIDLWRDVPNKEKTAVSRAETAVYPYNFRQEGSKSYERAMPKFEGGAGIVLGLVGRSSRVSLVPV